METLSEKHYTYEDYLELSKNDRIELIDGKIYKLPLPNRVHQDISQAIEKQFMVFLADKPYKMYHAPFRVRLFDQQDTVTDVVEPDISVICDLEKLDDDGCNGAPDLIIEILSRSSAIHDKWVKFKLYERAKVREYWIVDPLNDAVEVYLLDEEGLWVINEVYTHKDKAKVTVLPDCEIDLSTVLPEIK